MTFYRFHQNNSGGMHIVDDRVTINVFIEADNDIEADAKAETVGIYFEGCDTGMDCECCGDRWYRSDDNDSDNADTPTLYGIPIENHSPADEYWVKVGEPYAHVYYKDGRKVTFLKKGEA